MRTTALAALASITILASSASAQLLGDTPGYPQIFSSTNTRTTSYNAGTQIFQTGTPVGAPATLTLVQGGTFPTGLGAIANASVTVKVQINNAGVLVGGVAGDDLVVTGTSTVNSVPYSSPLLTGEVIAFGSQESGTTTDNFDFRFQVTGGSLASFYSGKYISLKLTSESSTFASPAKFTTNFDGFSKITIGPIPGTCTGMIGDVVFHDLDNNGIQNVGDPGLDGVTVRLKNSSGQVVDTRVTNVGPSNQHGYYQFTGVCLGTYTVEVDTPNGFQPTASLQGSDRTVDSNGSPTTVILPLNNSTDQTIDFGFSTVCAASVGNFVWYDQNRNGKQDSGELGIDGVKVLLKTTSGTQLNFTTTLGGGAYSFTGLCPGSYVVEVDATTIPAGYTQTTVNAGGTTTADDSNGSPFTVNLPLYNSVDNTVDFGYVAPCTAKIGNFVWYDQNQNGIQDPGEPGLTGVAVKLLDNSMNFIAMKTTDGFGKYEFDGLCAGTYFIQLDTTTAPANFSPTFTGASGSTPANDSNTNPTAVVLPDNTSNLDVDFGLKAPCSGQIGNLVWNDLNRNGIQDLPTEPGIGGITLNLRNALDNSIINTAVTQPDGSYAFNGLCPGTYKVEIIVPPGYVLTPTSPPAGGVASNDSNPNPSVEYLPFDNSVNVDVDFGLQQLGSIGDRVWHDLNGDTNQTGEPGINGVTVTISGVNLPSGYVASQTTTGDGNYKFENLPDGTYTVCVSTPPSGYRQTYDLDGISTAHCTTVVLGSGQNRTDVDFGYQQLGSIGDRVWHDINGDTNQAGEPGINGLTVTITGANLPIGYVASQTTSGDGLYNFTGLPAGTYTVCVSTPPAGFSQTYDLDGLVTAHCATAILAAGQSRTDVDFGYRAIPVAIQCPAITVGTVGVPFSVTMTASGGVGPYTFEVVGTLPAGLTLNAATGEVAGTPTAAGTFSVRAKDSTGAYSTTSCPFTINPPVTIQCPAITVGTVGVPFSVTMTATGGVGPYTFEVVGTLPAGLTLNAATGQITGTPTAAGTFSVRAKDSNGTVSTTSCPFTINPPVTIQCPAITVGTVGVPFSVTMTATGGVGPYTFEVVGTLPAGLTLNASTGEVSGTPTAAGTFSVRAKDSNGTVSTTSCPFTINPPVTIQCPAITVGTVGVPFSVTMTATGGVGPYTFEVVGTLPAGLTLNAATGQITGTPTAAGTFSVRAKDSNGTVSTTSCPFTINPPVTIQCPAITVGTVGVPFSVTMTATGGVGPYTFEVVGTLPAGLTLNAATGEVAGTPTAAGTFSVRAKDSNGTVSTTSCPFTINPPVTIQCPAITVGTVGVPFSVTMTATGGVGPYTFEVVGTLPAGLTLNAATGQITGTPTAAGTFSVRAKDSNGTVSTTSCPFTINPPVTIQCPAITVGTVGVPFSVTMTATGGVGPYTFEVVGTLPAGLTLNAATGQITGTPTAAGTFSVRAKDSNGTVSTTSCPFTINPPVTIQCPAITVGTVGVPFSVTMTATGGVGPYTFEVVGTLPAGLTLNASTGEVSGTPTAAGTFSVRAKDSNGTVSTTSCPFTINPPVTIQCPAITVGTVGVPFSVTMTATGGVGPYTFEVVGTLPAGLTLNAATGQITGTPTAAGTFSVRAKDSNGTVSTTSCPFTINPPVTIQCPAITVGTVGVPFSVTMTATGGVGPYTFEVVGTLPAGLTLNAATGQITGTPTAAGTFSVRAKDSNGTVSTTSCPFTINPPVTIQCPAITVGTVGVPFSVTMTATGGVGPYTFEVVSTLPAGLTLNAATGQITGTPTAAGTFSVRAKDSNGTVSTTSCPFTINPPVTIQCPAITVGTVGVPFSVTMTATGGVGPYTFEVVGTLPAGLTLNAATGQITGTPTAAGTFSVRAKDSNGTVSTTSCPFTINPPVTIQCPAITVGTVGVPFSVTMTATGGVGPYTFEVVGTLPAGLTLNAATGQITGTPTAAGTFSVRAKDSKGTVSTTSCPFTINPPVNPLTLACPSGKGSVGAPYSSTLAVTGGTGGNVFAIVSGSLPPGLTLNTTTGAITGTPTAAGTFNVKFSVKDSSGTTVYASCSGSCAAVTSFNFTVPAGQLGSTQPYTANGVTLTAYGYNGSGTTGTPRALFGKTAGGNENGLGIYGTSADNEITTSTFIQVDTSDLVAKGATNVQMLIGSVQSGEGYDIYGSNTLGTIGTKLLSGGTSESPFAMPGYGTYRYISVRASAVDVLLNGISFVLPSDCQIVITPALTLTCSSNNTCSEGSSHSSTVTASGGVAPYTFSVATGTIPNGLTLNSSTGAVTGTPTTSGSFTIKVTDSLGTTASNTCPYSVSAKLALGCASSTTGTVGVAFNSTITATGGFPGYTFAVATGSLPAGLTLNSATGAITGTPTASGTFTLKVTDSKGNVATSTCSITINPGVSLGSIGDRVWNDPNCLGTQGSGEAGLVGWTVNITGPSGYSATTTTGTNGIYGFPNLPAGTYTVCVNPQAGYVQTYDLNGLSTANCATVTLTAGQNRKDVDFGYRTTSSLGSIGNKVWNDIDGDGVQDSGEGGLKGVKVTIAGPNGYSATTSTASDGSYKFSNLGAGSYTVCVSNLPSGYIQTYDLDGKATAHCATVNLAAAQNRTDVDFGYRCPPGTGSIGNRVWNDVDGNGTQEGSGYGINGVTVTLTGATSATATTNGDGDYSFVNLPAGTYKVCVSNLPSGYTQTYDLDGLGSASCANLTITSGQVKTDVDFGYWKKTTTGSIGDRVWNDADGDGCQDSTETGLTGWTVKITGPSSYSATATTGTDGAYSFSGLAAGTYAVCVTPQAGFTQTYDRDGLATPNCASITITAGQNKTDADFGYKSSTAATGSIGDRVWDDGNGNGIQESAGNGLNGVKVTITGPNGYTANMLTAGDGNYKFSNLAAGTYTVCTSNLPSGYTQTYDLDGIGSGNCATMTLAKGQARNDVDFGYWKQGTALGSIGDRVWNDASCTGSQGYGEAGLTGWTVKITGPNSYSATATTGSNGTYKFSNLAAGTYTVCVTPQSGFVQTYDLTGLGSANCASIALAAGSNRTDVDFGYRKP